MGSVSARATFLAAWLLLALGGSALAAGPLGTINEYRTGLTPNSRPSGLLPASDGSLWFTDNAAIGRITTGGEITEFTGPLTSESRPSGLVAGVDGYLWFIDHRAIGRISLDGTITEFPLVASSQPADLVLGAEGAIWFTDGFNAAIGRITEGGEVTYYTAGLKQGAAPGQIVLGREGDLWFADDSEASPAIGRITPSGEITEFSAGLEVQGLPGSIVLGQDGNLWFADNGVGKAIARVTPGGEVTLYKGNLGEACSRGCGPSGLIDGPDEDVWLTVGAGDGGLIGQITPAGVTSEFTPSLGLADRPGSLVSVPDGNLWFSDSTIGFNGLHWAIGRMTPAGAFSWFSQGLDPESVGDLAVGSDGNVWFVNGPAIGRISVSGSSAAPTMALAPARPSPAPKRGRISLVHRGLLVSRGVTTLKLRCTGNSRCAGKLTVTIRAKRTRRSASRTVEIANAVAFSVAAGAVESVKIHLRHVGRTKLDSGRHRLNCTLVVDRKAPAPTSTTRFAIQLTQKRDRRHTAG
jgi:virginiamycin B lyase